VTVGCGVVGELVLRVLGEVILPAEEDHLVLQQCVADHLDGDRIQIAAEPDVVDARADTGAELGHHGGGWGGGCDRHEITFAVEIGYCSQEHITETTPLTRVFVALIANSACETKPPPPEHGAHRTQLSARPSKRFRRHRADPPPTGASLTSAVRGPSRGRVTEAHAT
jgi:hypothetical protein